MTTIRAVAAHEIVRQAFPRPEPVERERVAIAVGRAIDGTVSDCGHQLRIGRRPTASALGAVAAHILSDAFSELQVQPSAEEEQALLEVIARVVQAYRKSVIAGLPRPKSRLVVLDGTFGYYAQPDCWDGKSRFYEMKSFRAVPPPPDVLLQVRLFQLAFPNLEAVVIGFDRHSNPVQTLAATVPPPSEVETEATLTLARDTAERLGKDKVLEYVDSPQVHYRLAPAHPTGGPG